MNESLLRNEEFQLKHALEMARDTRYAAVERGIRHAASDVFNSCFGTAEAIVIADGNTHEAAGRDVEASLLRRNHVQPKRFLFGPDVYADDSCVRKLVEVLRLHQAIPVAVGSGTINDLTKLAAHLTGRPYMVIGTAASMDGYLAFGASITKSGSKDTVDCPGPRAVLVDLDVIAKAPNVMNAWGYVDLMAKEVCALQRIDQLRLSERPKIRKNVEPFSHLRAFLSCDLGINM